MLPRVSYDKAHLPGAVHCSFYDDGFAGRVEALAGGRDVRVVVYCARRSCNASARAAAALDAGGFANVLDFAGGVQEWKEAGYELGLAQRP